MVLRNRDNYNFTFDINFGNESLSKGT